MLFNRIVRLIPTLPVITFNRRNLSCLPLFLLALNLPINAEEQQRVPTEQLVEGIKSSDGRWFEVEVIIFERTDNEDIREQFDNEIKNLSQKRQWDLLSPAIYPDISLLRNALPECWQNLNPLSSDNDQGQTLPADQFFEQMMAYQKLITSDWRFTQELCLLPSESLSGYWQLTESVNYIDDRVSKDYDIDQMPNYIVAAEYDDFHNVYLLTEKNLQLKDHYNKLKKHKNTRPVLHIGWRQPGLSKKRSMPFYIMAGTNFSKEFNYDGTKKVTTAEINLNNDMPAKTDDDHQFNGKNRASVNSFMEKLNAGAVVDFKNGKLIYPKKVSYPEKTWQIDGYIQVHLDHYLFLNAEFNYRQRQSQTVSPKDYLNDQHTLILPKSDRTTDVSSKQMDAVVISKLNDEVTQSSTEEDLQQVTIEYLQNYPFKQNRRTYSGDLHLLDHPKMGILFQIRKYRH